MKELFKSDLLGHGFSVLLGQEGPKSKPRAYLGEKYD